MRVKPEHEMLYQEGEEEEEEEGDEEVWLHCLGIDA